MLLEGVEPACAGGDGSPGIAPRVGLQCPGQPGHAPGQRRPAAAGPRGAFEMLVGCWHTPPAQGDAPGEQVCLHRLVGPGSFEAVGNLLGVPEQARGMLARGISGLGEDEAGTRLPDRSLLCPELPVCLTCPLPGASRIACGQSGSGGREEQIRRLYAAPPS